MAKNAGESRIPVPRTVRPSLLPKIRSLGPQKISSIGHRRSPPVFGNNKQQFGNNKTASSTNLVLEAPPTKQSKPGICDIPESDKESILGADYSIAALWNATADNKEVDHLMRLNDEQLEFLRSQEDLSGYVEKKKLQSHENVNLSSENIDYVPIESPATTTPHYLMLTKQNSFEHDHDESLGILTPDQMTDFTVALESSRTPSCENLSGANSNKFLHSKSSEVVAAAARHLDLAARVPSIDALSSVHDRSPSLEELPLDPKPVIIIAQDVEQLEASLNEKQPAPSLNHQTESSKALTVDSSETSEHTSDQTTRSTSVGGGQVLPTSFITSVTSITSLEAGYQGDGENSRPASRGPEPLSVAPVTNLVSKACRQDPMTDSDFFTESDVDGHEEIVRGDRRAQVIDGTLFCANPHERRCLSFEPEEMDSSGIYSDLEKRQDGVIGDVDGDGDHTTDTGDTEISLKSQLSPRDQLAVPLVIHNVLSPPAVLNDTNESISTTSTAEVTVIKCQKNEQNTATKSKSRGMSNKENSAPLKKYKMPKRNVISKIKTMIEANNVKEETQSEPKRHQRQQRKNGRWEAVMSKIEAGKQRSRPQKKEIKSRVLEGLATVPASSTKRERRIRARPDTSNSPNQETARSSVRSSASDLSNTLSKEILKRPPRKTIGEQQPIINNQQLNTASLNKSNLGQVRKNAPSLKSVQSNVNGKQKNAPTSNKVAERNNRAASVNNAKDESVSTILNHHVNLHHNNNHNNNNHHNNNNNNNNNHNGVRKTLVPVSELEVVDVAPSTPPKQHVVDTREQEVQVDLSMVIEEEEEPQQHQHHCQEPNHEGDETRSELLYVKANNVAQALAITVQYLNNQIDSTKTENANLRLQKASLQEDFNQEIETHRISLENLHYELSQANQKETTLESKLETERCRSEKLERSLAERERQHREALERLAAEHESELNQARAQQVVPKDQVGLYAEIESLRTVLELRSQEYASLRSEADLLRREMDDKEVIRHKYESLQARCEDIQAQLHSKEENERKLIQEQEVLLGSIHQMSKQIKRLNQKNEELYWRLRHKNETLSAMRYQLGPHQPTNRLSKSLDTENADPYVHHDQSVDSSNCSQKSETYESPSCSMIKYMIEKSDSVSWTLDITDDFDRSCSPSPATAKNGVKRQNSLRLSNQRRTLTPSRSRAGSVAAPASNSSCESVRKAAAAAAAVVVRTPKKETSWTPPYNSTPNPSKTAHQRRRTIADAGETSWSLTNNIMENTSGNNSGNIGCSANSSKVLAALEVLTDEDEDEAVGQRPQEAGGEAMISEETSATSSSEEDDSSVSSSDIP